MGKPGNPLPGGPDGLFAPARDRHRLRPNNNVAAPVAPRSNAVPRLVPALAAVCFTFTVPPISAADPVPDTRVLTAVLRDQLLKNLPTPLVETKNDWGKQKLVTVGWDVKRSGPLRWDSAPRTGMRNDGHWHKLVVVVKDAPRTLAFELKDVKSPEDGKLTFAAYVSADVDLTFEQQLWKAGARLYSGETRGRCRAGVVLGCESTTRFEHTSGAILPTPVVRVRVTDATLYYDKLVIEHTLGVGGDAAKVIGETAHKLMARLKPSLERELLAKANAAIVKAGDTKDIRIGFEKLLSAAKAK